MKNVFLFIVVLCFCTGLYAQPFGIAASNYRIVKLDYENSNGERGSTDFKYDIKGQLLKSFWSLENNKRNSTNLYEHDSNGNIISAYREFSDGLTSYEIFTYDDDGNKISEYFRRSDSVTGTATYQYKGDRLIKAELKNYKGWLNGTITYQYMPQKKKVKAVLENKGNVIGNITYEYDDYDNLKTEHWDFGGRFSQTFICHYEKSNLYKNYYSSPFLSNSGQSRISEEGYTFNNEAGGPSYYYYDENGLLFKKVFQRSDSVSTTTFYKYDSERKLISSERTYNNGNVARFTYNYDENNYLVLRSFYLADTLYGFESYQYNAEGDLINAYLKNFDTWLSGTISFKANEMGKIISGEFKGENGFDAILTFTYNSEGLLSEINWDFSFGKFQHYNFEYISTRKQ